MWFDREIYLQISKKSKSTACRWLQVTVNHHKGYSLMCQLLGVSFNQPVPPIGPFSQLVRNSVMHPDGWGVAYYIDGSTRATIFKEFIPAYQSQLAQFLFKYSGFSSRTFIAHIRKATKGLVTLDNTHPFNRYHAGREYVFAHNGSLSKPKRLTRLYFKPIGDTDSERAFCYLLTQLRRCEIKRVWRDDGNWYGDVDFQVILKILHEINARAAGSFNCLFSDGEYLFAYRDLQEARNLFWMQYHEYPQSNSTRKNLITKKSAIGLADTLQGFIIATQPVMKGDWQPFTGGQLMVFKHGELIADLQ
jgi:glutamine amidotransferase